MNSGRPVFSLKAYLLAPLPVPLVAGALFALGNSHPGSTFFLTFFFGLIVSGLGTTALVVSLWIIAKVRPVTKTLTTLTGIGLAAFGYLCVLYLNWSSSGPDSGPPVETFGAHLLRNWNDAFLYIFLAGGLVTSFLYAFLASADHRSPPARDLVPA